MATTRVSGGTAVCLLQNGDSLNTTLNATSPLYQTFKKGTTEYSPNWATMQDSLRPVIFPRCYSPAEGAVLPITNPGWKYNNVPMTFDGTGLCTAPDVAAGKIRQVDYSGGKALKMIGNVASDTNNDSDTISFTGKVDADGQTIDIGAEITLLIEEAAANLYRLFLNMVDDVIDGDETELEITASLFNMGTIVTSGVQYEFTTIDGTVLRAKGSSPNFTITRAMIDSSLLVVCKAYVSDDVVAQEHRQVWDSVDGVNLLCNYGDRNSQSKSEDLSYTYWLENNRTQAVLTGGVIDISVRRLFDKEDISSEFTITADTVVIPGAKINEHKHIYISAVAQINL